MTAVDLWCALVDAAEQMRCDALIDRVQCDAICADLKQAMWHSGNPHNTKQNLKAVAYHYGLPVPSFDSDCIMCGGTGILSGFPCACRMEVS